MEAKYISDNCGRIKFHVIIVNFFNLASPLTSILAL